MMKTHCFEESHKFGKSVEGAWYWPDVYGLHFGRFQEIQLISGGADNKKYGDHKVVFRGDGDTSGHYQYVDVKARTKRYGDILIESHHSKEKDPHNRDAMTLRGWGHPDHELDAHWIAYVVPGMSGDDFRRVALFGLGCVRAWGYVFDKDLKHYSAHNESDHGNYWTHSVVVPWDKFFSKVISWHYAVDMNAKRVYELPADMQNERDFKPDLT